MKYDFLIVGAGFAGSVMAERIATQLNKTVLLIDKRDHTGGNAFDEFDEYGILVHRYGPHIFHTNSRMVFDYLSQFTRWRRYEHHVRARHNNRLYPLPVNRLTINKLYNLKLSDESETARYLAAVREFRYPVTNSEDLIVNQIGYDLFRVFYKNYTFKQWHKYPDELNASVCGRIQARLNDDCRYFTDLYQCMPLDGYNTLFRNILRNKKIEILLKTDFKEIVENVSYGKMIYTGPIDLYFDYEFGKLPYRSIRFEFENHECERYQQFAQINHVDDVDEFTRVVEHKYLSGQKADTTTITKEYPQFPGEPLYPVLTQENRELFRKYAAESVKEKNVIFCGRLAEYRYYNMDQVIANTLKKFEEISNEK